MSGLLLAAIAAVLASTASATAPASIVPDGNMDWSKIPEMKAALMVEPKLAEHLGYLEDLRRARALGPGAERVLGLTLQVILARRPRSLVEAGI